MNSGRVNSAPPARKAGEPENPGGEGSGMLDLKRKCQNKHRVDRLSPQLKMPSCCRIGRVQCGVRNAGCHQSSPLLLTAPECLRHSYGPAAFRERQLPRL